jgi:signal transduction histidine kinase
MRPASAAALDSVERILAEARTGIVQGGPPHPLPGGSQLAVKDAIAAPLAGSNGVVGAILAINRLGDVSTFDRNDARMLETISNQVGVSLENGRLEDSLAELTELKERLEELVKSKDEFVASVSHELRTPLTAVFGLAEELRVHREAFSDGELEEFISVIADQSHELTDLVEDLLVAARAEIGTLNLAIESIEPLDLLTEMLGSNPALNSVVREIRGKAGAIEADPMRTRQILRNLMINAERYGGEKVWVELRHQGKDQVVIAVVDDGDGVPESARESIFNAYERAHNAAGQPSSVGLGLAVSRRLARLMGGDLQYRSEYGLTLFELILPTSTGTRRTA